MQKEPTYLVIRTLHVQFDRHQALANERALQIMHEFLDKQEIAIDDISSIDH